MGATRSERLNLAQTSLVLEPFSSRNQELETTMNEWLKPHIEETQAGWR